MILLQVAIKTTNIIASDSMTLARLVMSKIKPSQYSHLIDRQLVHVVKCSSYKVRTLVCLIKHRHLSSL